MANDLCAKLRAKGFDPYLAIAAQTILEINSGIIRELKQSDHYLLVNFCRDCLSHHEGTSSYRGSLFSNQELAIAYALSFEHILVVNQLGVADEGMLRYIGVNTERFQGFEDCVDVVVRAVDRAGWGPHYSRRLKADRLRLSSQIISYGNLVGTFLYVDICNLRPDIAALETTARLTRLGKPGKLRNCEIRSPLKATGRPGYAHTIFPGSHEAFDLLCISFGHYEPVSPIPFAVGTGNSTTVFNGISIPKPKERKKVAVHLNTALDVSPIVPVLTEFGLWLLEYEFYAIEFPLLSVEIELALQPGKSPEVKIVSQNSAR